MNFKTFCLSLKSNTNRREWMNSIKENIGLDFEFWDATTPNDLTDEIKEKYFKHVNFYEWDIIQEAAMATFISHMKLLEHAINTNTNILIIEDDIDIISKFDWDSVNFDEFDIFKMGLQGVNCYSYFVSVNGAKKVLKYLNENAITEAYDWELYKMRDLNVKYLKTPIFVQVQNKFESNIAPRGYNKIKNGNGN